MNTILIDGVSSDAVRLRFDKLPLYPAAKRRTNTYTIPGSGEDITTLTDDYDDIPLVLEAYLVGSTTIQAVYDWIRSGTQLILSTQPGVRTTIKQVGEIAPARIGWDAHKISIPLTLAPFRYRVANDAITLSESPAQLQTIGNLYSLPVYHLTGCAGDISLTVNGTTLSVTDAPGTVTIDIGAQTIYSTINDVPQSILDTTSGAFWNMVLHPGDVPNQISWAGTVGSVAVTRNERWV